ncbi:hypothetical protein CYLTODRAFT_488322 [Cylindrobasidium torrendii FP15055 ss-10]|uniref:Uncharacterized protein n=1 Tax=Cylindrobasidium torrendii FP15055 ss-10 TaxID=1314674 RepID=A0A0D7BIY0_9AGAR|nr:hypothetical protein CYLTODRAFT_488322 [Cylindrobasidium torrendii FP15055 ss-10]
MSLDIETLSAISQPPWQVNEDRRQWVTAIYALHPNGPSRHVLQGKSIDEDDGLMQAVQSVAAVMLRVNEAPTIEEKYIIIETEYKASALHLFRTYQGWNLAITGLTDKLKYKADMATFYKATLQNGSKCILPDKTYLAREKWMNRRDWGAFVRAMVQWKTWDLTRNHCQDAANALRECIEAYASVVRQILTARWPGPTWARMHTHKAAYLDAFRKLGRETDEFNRAQPAWMSTLRFEDAVASYGLPRQPSEPWCPPVIAAQTLNRPRRSDEYGASRPPANWDAWSKMNETRSTSKVSATHYGGKERRFNDDVDGRRSAIVEFMINATEFLGGVGGDGGGGGGVHCDGGGGSGDGGCVDGGGSCG